MSSDLAIRDLVRLSWIRIGYGSNARAQAKIGEIGSAGGPDVRPNAPTALVGSILDRSPSPHGGPSPSSSAPRHCHPPPANGHPALGAARSRPIRPRIAANNARGTAPSSIWNVRV